MNITNKIHYLCIYSYTFSYTQIVIKKLHVFFCEPTIDVTKSWDYGGDWVGKGDGYKDGEGRAASVVFKFRIYPFLYTVNIILSPTDL
jgi:hypothetical protein